MGLIKEAMAIQGPARKAAVKRAEEYIREAVVRRAFPTETDWVKFVLGDLWRTYRDCGRCPGLCADRGNVVLGQGRYDADLLVVAPAPGPEEDAGARAQRGPEGEFLRAVLRLVGVPEARVFFTYAVMCRPPEGRAPTRGEIDKCRERLLRTASALRPRGILVLGAPGAQALGVPYERGLIGKARWPKLGYAGARLELVGVAQDSSAVYARGGKAAADYRGFVGDLLKWSRAVPPRPEGE